MTLATDQLLEFIFDGKSHSLSASMDAWLTSSRRFTDFAEIYKDKIRKKIRTTQDQKTLLDLRLELETAYLFLHEPRLSLVYEPGLSEKIRRPDFAVSFTTSLTFMVEVTRVRIDHPNMSDYLSDAIFSKCGQLLPRHSNVLIIGVEKLNFTNNDLQTILVRLQQRAERNDTMFLKKYGFHDRADFFQHFQRLSEILVRETETQASIRSIAWINPQAKHPLPGKVRTALYRSHAV